MNTYPIGFKGTPGNWRTGRASKNWIVSDIAELHDVPNVGKFDGPHQNYDALLASASKKMAVALQNLISLNTQENRQAAHDILIEAGLYSEL